MLPSSSFSQRTLDFWPKTFPQQLVLYLILYIRIFPEFEDQHHLHLGRTPSTLECPQLYDELPEPWSTNPRLWSRVFKTLLHIRSLCANEVSGSPLYGKLASSFIYTIMKPIQSNVVVKVLKCFKSSSLRIRNSNDEWIMIRHSPMKNCYSITRKVVTHVGFTRILSSRLKIWWFSCLFHQLRFFLSF